MHTNLDLQSIKEDLEQLLYKAAEIARRGFESEHKDTQTKSDANDVVTKYDIEINDLIVDHLRENYPDFSIISEESPTLSGTSDYSFVIDPIDGTRNFTRGVPIFFTGIGIAKDEQAIFSITLNPITDELFYAIKGGGAFCNGQRLKVSTRTAPLSDITLCTFPDKTHQKNIFLNIIERVHQIRNNVCCHEEISGVACQKYDAFVAKGPSAWDYYHYLLVEEAGGRVTDWAGDEFDISKDNIIVSNGEIGRAHV